MNIKIGLLTIALSLTFIPVEAQLAQGKSKFLGNVWSSSQAPNFTTYWNQVTPENAGKWGSVEGTRDQMNWSGLDQAYALAKNNDFPFKLHVLVWGSQQPQWLGDLSPDEQLEEITEWFGALAERYPDMDIVEVVNEPLHQPPTDYIEALGGTGDTGWDWVIESFTMAREYFPNAQLILNDYGILGNTTNINRYLQIINLLKDRGLVDQLGIQGHAFTVNDLSAETITNNLNVLSAPELPIFVTELDIDGSTDEVQLSRYQEVFPALWEHPSVRGITLWGYRPGMWRTDQKAYLIDYSGQERPALVWLREYVETTDPDAPIVAGVDIKEKISVYPNPIQNQKFTVSHTGTSTRIQVVDLHGRIHRNFEGIQENRAYSISLEPGLYIFQFLKGGRLLQKQKVIIN